MIYFSNRISLILILIFFKLSAINCTEFTSCSSTNNGVLNSITISNCDSNDVRCLFKQNTNVSMNLEFKINQDLKTAKIKISGILSGIAVPFRALNVCDYGVSCPMQKNRFYKVFISFPIRKTYPKIKLTVQVALENQIIGNILCVRFPAQIIT